MFEQSCKVVIQKCKVYLFTICTGLRHSSMSVDIIFLGDNSFEGLRHFFGFQFTAKLKNDIRNVFKILFYAMATHMFEFSVR